VGTIATATTVADNAEIGHEDSQTRSIRSSGPATSDVPLNEVIVDFSASIQPLGALQEAAYRVIGQAACQIDEAEGRYVCRLSPSQPQLRGDELRSHFLNLVTDENLRQKVSNETGRLRDVIVALAFGALAGEN
jgi:His-Xaa-Ser system protein HxsD